MASHTKRQQSHLPYSKSRYWFTRRNSSSAPCQSNLRCITRGWNVFGASAATRQRRSFYEGPTILGCERRCGVVRHGRRAARDQGSTFTAIYRSVDFIALSDCTIKVAPNNVLYHALQALGIREDIRFCGFGVAYQSYRRGGKHVATKQDLRPPVVHAWNRQTNAA